MQLNPVSNVGPPAGVAFDAEHLVDQRLRSADRSAYAYCRKIAATSALVSLISTDIEQPGHFIDAVRGPGNRTALRLSEPFARDTHRISPGSRRDAPICGATEPSIYQPQICGQPQLRGYGSFAYNYGQDSGRTASNG